jgi:hypothetical protein
MEDNKVTKVELGQFYKDVNHFGDGNIYLVTNAYVSTIESAYLLINIKTGCAYALPVRDIDMIFDNDTEDFVLIKNVEIIIS